MEKYYFKDRSKQAGIPNYISPGDVVYICTKEMQKHAKTIEHLQKGIVVYKLTKKVHPRGIKVVIYPIRSSINPTPEQIKKVLDYCDFYMDEIRSENGPIAEQFKKGRITYILDSEGNIV